MIPRNFMFVAGIVFLVAAPAAISTMAFMITKDPSLRPLARTKNDVEIFRGAAGAGGIIAYVRWPVGRAKNFTQPELASAIRDAFAVHGTEVRVVIETVSGKGAVTVGYRIGASRFAPRPVTRMTDGIKGAVIAIRMYQETN